MKLRIALFVTLCAIAFHIYMTLHYQSIVYGNAAGQSICNVNDLFSCDRASASSIATFLGIPIAAWGASANFILFLLLFTWMAGLVEDIGRVSRITHFLTLGISLISVFMAILSTLVVKAYCPFCILIYVLSFINLFLIQKSLPQDSRPYLSHIKEVFLKNRSYLWYSALVPFFAFSLDWAISKDIHKAWPETRYNSLILEWESSRNINTDASPSLTSGADAGASKLQISEFADFLCHHCKNAAKTLKVYLATRKDINFKFYSFPLDGTCNAQITSPGNNVRCYLAKAVICAEDLSKQGWPLHDFIFSNQDTFISANSVTEAKSHLDIEVKRLGLTTENFETCIASPEVSEKLKNQVAMAADAKISGTPGFVVNGRLLPQAPTVPIIERIYKQVANQ